MSGKIQIRLAVLAAAAAIAALFAGALTAQADTVRMVSVEVQPDTTTAGTPTEFTFTITNYEGSDKDLGSAQIVIAENAVFTNVEFVSADPGWELDSVAGNILRVSAINPSDVLAPGHSVIVKANATAPLNDGGDIIADIDVGGRIATDFSESMPAPGNTFTEFEDENSLRPGLFDVRSGSGVTTETTLRTDQVLITGKTVDCKTSCTGSLTQYDTIVTVSVPSCDEGTLVIDTTNTTTLPGNQIGAAVFYDYFGNCDEGSEVIVDIQYLKAPDVDLPSPGSIDFQAFYGKDISEFDDDYVLDGNDLPDCKRDITKNCENFVKGGSDAISAQVKMVLTDPFLRGTG